MEFRWTRPGCEGPWEKAKWDDLKFDPKEKVMQRYDIVKGDEDQISLKNAHTGEIEFVLVKTKSINFRVWENEQRRKAANALRWVDTPITKRAPA
jgi:hypothetical protein